MPCAAVMFITARAIAPNEFVFMRISERIVPAVNLSLIFAALALALPASELRKKIKEKKRKKGIDKV